MEVYLYRKREEQSKNISLFHCNVLTDFYLLTLMINEVLFHFVSVHISFRDFNGNRVHTN